MKKIKKKKEGEREEEMEKSAASIVITSGFSTISPKNMFLKKNTKECYGGSKPAWNFNWNLWKEGGGIFFVLPRPPIYFLCTVRAQQRREMPR